MQSQPLTSLAAEVEKLTNKISLVIQSIPDWLTEPTPGGKQRRIARKVHLPYFGETPTDVFLFAVSAVSFRFYLWWRRRGYNNSPRGSRGKSSGWRTGRNNLPSSCELPVKSTPLPGYKDRGLYEFMDKAKERKAKLRRVEDPEVARKKKKEIRNNTKPSGPLGLSKETLKDKRKGLKQTGRFLVQENGIDADGLPV